LTQNDLIALRVEFAEVLQSALDGFQPRLSGSYSDGTRDVWSDVDFAFENQNATVEVVRGMLIELKLSAEAELLLAFSADHLCLPSLLITLWRYRGVCVKVDMACAITSVSAFLPTLQRSERYYSDRAICWLYFGHGKLERQAFLEARSAIELLRDHALLPLMQLERDLSRTGYKFAESELDESSRDLLWQLQLTAPNLSLGRTLLDEVGRWLIAYGLRRPSTVANNVLQFVGSCIGGERNAI
jgi:hypothetical protein